MISRTERDQALVPNHISDRIEPCPVVPRPPWAGSYLGGNNPDIGEATKPTAWLPLKLHSHRHGLLERRRTQPQAACVN